MGATTTRLYETDFAAWAEETAALIREGRWADLDVDAVVEEIEGLAGSEKSAVRSQLRRLMMHLIKERVQPERASRSWRVSVVNARTLIMDRLDDSPSLRNHVEDRLQRLYSQAVEAALAETGVGVSVGQVCPWT